MLCPNLKNVFIGKNLLRPFWCPWDQEVVVAKAKFGISSIFYEFSLEFSLIWGLKLFDPCDLGNPKRGSGNFFKNYILEISVFQQKNEVYHSFLVKIFTKFFHRGGVCFISLAMAPERVNFGSQKPFFQIKSFFCLACNDL